MALIAFAMAPRALHAGGKFLWFPLNIKINDPPLADRTSFKLFF